MGKLLATHTDQCFSGAARQHGSSAILGHERTADPVDRLLLIVSRLLANVAKLSRLQPRCDLGEVSPFETIEVGSSDAEEVAPLDSSRPAGRRSS